MKLPSSISEISIYEDHESVYPYPPAGWLPFWEHELGNGDMYGLYWPVGKEGDDPLVVEMWHDSRDMSPQFSSLETFLASSNILDDEFERPVPTNPLDEDSPVVLIDQAKALIADGNVLDAIRNLERATQVLPEYTDAKNLLTAQHRRNRDLPSALLVCLDALRSPLAFGRPNRQLALWFSRQNEAPDSVASDPLWARRGELSWSFGGVKQNDDYLVLRDIVEEYANRDEWAHWYNMAQLYGELMSSETVAFQERYDFDSMVWQATLVSTYKDKTGIDRNSFCNNQTDQLQP